MENTQPDLGIHLIGIGASAGGLEALQKFFQSLDEDWPAAFVVIQHLSPDYKSYMPELLSRETHLNVLRAEEGMPVKRGHVYSIPPKNILRISNGRFVLEASNPHASLNLPIDEFFRSIAEEFGEKAVSIVLSGTGSDGMRGLRDVKGAGGVVFVQSESDAKFDGMPRSAISTGLADAILPVKEMPKVLSKLLQGKSFQHLIGDESPDGLAIDSVSDILSLIHSKKGLNFSKYKPNTIHRRLERRLGVCKCPDLKSYVQLLRQDPDELEQLYSELLIRVTSFFRDKELFENLSEKVLPQLIPEDTPVGRELRLWVSACSTGEEAYSYAILIKEYLDHHKLNVDVKIFATDLDQTSIEVAAKGIYPESIVADVSQERLDRFFERFNDQYQIKRTLRQMVVFAPHNLLDDPPFTKMDLVSCRNVLIYFQPEVQKRVLAKLTFSLNNNGVLVLGSSENITPVEDLYRTINSKWKIYQNNAMKRPLGDMFQSGSDRPTLSNRESASEQQMLRPLNSLKEHVYQDMAEAMNTLILVLDQQCNLLHVFGESDSLLQMPRGKFISDVTKIVHPDLCSSLGVALARARRDGEEIFYGGIQIEELGMICNLKVRYLQSDTTPGRMFLVYIQKDDNESEVHSSSRELVSDERELHLERELQFTRENLQATVEEFETTNEELQATNEELMASNEELQSTNEELQSVNEELQTVNSEHQIKLDQMTELNNDMNNLLNVTNYGILFLDIELNIRKFTPIMGQILKLMPQDVGRPLVHFSQDNLELNLIEIAKEILVSRQATEHHCKSSQGSPYLVRAFPYLTDGESLDGVVMTFVHLGELTSEQEGS